jgi:hypothetical protein
MSEHANASTNTNSLPNAKARPFPSIFKWITDGLVQYSVTPEQKKKEKYFHHAPTPPSPSRQTACVKIQ